MTELAARTAALAGLPAMEVLRQLRAAPDTYGALAAQAALTATAQAALTAGGGVDGHHSTQLLVVVDQFEEVFTHCPDPAERQAFVTALTSAAPALVVLAVRADFYPQCTGLERLVPLLAGGQFVVGPLDVPELRSAVLGPAGRARLEVEPGLVELLLADLKAQSATGYDPGAIPLLAHALRATWQRRQGRRLTVAGYRDSGGIRNAVADTAERIYLELDDQARARLRAALLEMVVLTEDGTAVRRRQDRARIEPAVLARLVDARLVTAGQDTVQISHEALLTAWPRLAEWVEQDRQAILVRQRLSDAARYWAESTEDPGALYRGARLATAREWAGGHPELPDLERRFLGASVAAAESERLVERRRTRRLRRLVAALAALLVLAVGAGAVAVSQRNTAEQRRLEATSRQLAAESLRAGDANARRSMELAVQAWRAQPTTEARGALLSAQMLNHAGLLGSDEDASAVAMSRDGRIVATGHRDGTVQLWDVASHRPIGQRLRGHQQQIYSMSFSSDGSLLATETPERDGVRVWEVPSGRLVRVLQVFVPVAWMPGSSVLVGYRMVEQPLGYFLTRWDARTGQVLGEFAVDKNIDEVAVSPAGTLVAAGYMDGKVRVWRLADGAEVVTIAAHKGQVPEVVFGPHGVLATYGVDSQVRLWELPSGRALRTLNRPGEQRSVGRLAFTPEGYLYATGGGSNVSSWDTATGDPMSPLGGFVGTPQDIGMSADGKLVVVAGVNDTTMLWRRGTYWLAHPDVVLDTQYDPTGRQLVTGSTDGKLRTFDTATLSIVSTRDLGSPVYRVAYAPDGTLASATVDGTVRLVNKDGRDRGVLGLDGLRPGPVVFSPDSGLVAVVGNTTPTFDSESFVNVYVWDARTLTRKALFRVDDATVHGLSFSRDGARLLAAVDITDATDIKRPQRAELRQWRTADFSAAGTVDLDTSVIYDMAVSPDNRTVILVGANHKIQERTLDGTRVVREYGDHPATVRAVAYSPDGRTVATVTAADSVIRIWDVRSGELLANLTGHSDQSNALAYSPDGRTLATASADQFVGLWNLDPERAVSRICGALGVDHPSCQSS